jgi:exosortase
LAVLTAFGGAVTRLVAIPVLFLYFAVPAWDLLAPPLQSLTLAIVGWLAPAIGIPATVSGTYVLLPDNMRFEVSLACSGSGFLMECLAVAVLVGELVQATVVRRLRLVAAMVIVAFVTNWIRVLALIAIGYSTAMRHVLVTEYHVLFGYVIFVLVLSAFVWITVHVRPLAPRADAEDAALGAPSRPGESAFLAALLGLAAAPGLAALVALFGNKYAVLVAAVTVTSR